MSHRPRPLPALALALVLVAVAVVLRSAPTTGRPIPPVMYQPPVDAPVTDPFRPPTTPYGPGNRGIEYATRPGTPVRAAAAGIVTFAGAVAGGLHVTVSHADGIRTTYSFLARILVRRGQRVAGGQVVGRAGARLHVGARRGTTYLDPASLWGLSGRPRVVLVPLDGGPPGPSIPSRRPRGLATRRAE